MGLKIADLLKWRDSVTLKNDDGEEINEQGLPLQQGEEPITVYLRIIGDDDLAVSYRMARVASQRKRESLTKQDSLDWEEASKPIVEANREQLIALINQARTSNLEPEARSGVTRPELPEIEEFAVDPDAASLAEQEAYQSAVEKVDEDYEKAVREYIEVREAVIKDELSNLSDDELKALALDEIGTILAMGEFYAELFDQKAARGSYLDKTYKIRAFDNVEDFKSATSGIKQQIIEAYLALEQRADGLKN